MTIEATLRELDAAIASANPKLHRTFAPGASEAALHKLRDVYGTLPAVVEQWYGWRAGSDDGIVPGTAWGLMTIDEAVREAKLAPPAHVPIVTGRDGSIGYVVERAEGARIAFYDRGEATRTVPFDAWLAELRGAWIREGSVLRVAFLRWSRSPMGWHMLVLPPTSRKRLSQLFGKLPLEITDASYVDGSTPIRITQGESSRLRATREPKLRVEIELGPDDLAAVTRGLRDKQETITLPGLDDVRLCFSDR